MDKSFFDYETIMPLVTGLVVVALTIGVIYVLVGQLAKKLTTLGEYFHVKPVKTFWSGVYLPLMRSAGEVRIILTMGGRNTPPYLTIRLLGPTRLKIGITKQGLGIRSLTKWGLLKDIKTGDPVFDDKYRVSSKDEMGTQAYLQDQARREAIDFFFNRGFTSLGLDEKAIGARKPNYKEDDLTPQIIEQCLEYLDKLKE